jgi:hypothetical protein
MNRTGPPDKGNALLQRNALSIPKPRGTITIGAAGVNPAANRKVANFEVAPLPCRVKPW